VPVPVHDVPAEFVHVYGYVYGKAVEADRSPAMLPVRVSLPFGVAIGKGFLLNRNPNLPGEKQKRTAGASKSGQAVERARAEGVPVERVD
jgi:hypothetical protein